MKKELKIQVMKIAFESDLDFMKDGLRNTLYQFVMKCHYCLDKDYDRYEVNEAIEHCIETEQINVVDSLVSIGHMRYEEFII